MPAAESVTTPYDQARHRLGSSLAALRAGSLGMTNLLIRGRALLRPGRGREAKTITRKTRKKRTISIRDTSGQRAYLYDHERTSR